jgi:hypothetical protein
VQQAMFAKNLPILGAAFLLTQFGAGPVSFDARTPGPRKAEAVKLPEHEGMKKTALQVGDER